MIVYKLSDQDMRKFTLEQKVIFAILAAQSVKKKPIPVWDNWASDYLTNKNRNDSAAADANDAADAADAAAAYSAANAARAAAAYSAANAARAAAIAADKTIDFNELAKKALTWDATHA